MPSCTGNTSNQKKSLFSAGLAHVCQDGLDASTYVLLPVLAATFGFSYTQVGAIKAAKSIALGLMELCSGFLTERFGETRLLIAGLLVAGIGYAAVSSASTVPLVVLLLIVVGTGGGLQHAPASSLVSKAFGNTSRRSALGLYNSSGDVGKLAFTALFSLSIGAGMAWQQVAFSYGVIAILAAAAIGMAMATCREVNQPAQTARPADDQESALGWGVLNVPQFSILLTVVFLDNVVQVGVLVFVAFLMLSNELPLSIATLATAMVLVGGVFGKAGCGYLADKIGVRRAFILVQLLTAAGLVSITVTSGWVAFALLLPLGVVSQGSTSITYGLLPDYIHEQRMARGYAILYSSTSIAAAIGAWLMGLAADVYGIDVAFMIMAMISMLALVPLLQPRVFAQERIL